MVTATMGFMDRLLRKDRPYVIAEIGSNFDQSKTRAYDLIKVASDAGADAVKFQLFDADVLYPHDSRMHDIFKKIELDPSWLVELKVQAESLNLDFLCSAFDMESFRRLLEVDIVAFKVASSELTNHRLLLAIAQTGKPLLLSTGMCTIVDVEESIELCRNAGNTNIAVMQCSSDYPAREETANLRVLSEYNVRFKCPLGYSDHTLGVDAALIALGLGATIFEKHITLDQSGDGPDHFYALEPREFGDYVSRVRSGYKALGSGRKVLTEFEKVNGRIKSLHAKKDLELGSRLEEFNIESKRPGAGIPERFTQAVVGKVVNRYIQAGEVITWADLD